MKVTSVYLEWLLKLKERQRLEAEAQKIARKIRTIEADLQRLECDPAIERGWRGDLLNQSQSGPGSACSRQPWGNYVFLLLLTLLVSVAFFM
ncbi:MAG: hypothetical protein AAFR42_15120 [Cyanobacteria bacterium J06628_6]